MAASRACPSGPRVHVTLHAGQVDMPSERNLGAGGAGNSFLSRIHYAEKPQNPSAIAFQTVPGMLGEDERLVNRELLPAGATRRQADSPAASLI